MIIIIIIIQIMIVIIQNNDAIHNDLLAAEEMSSVCNIGKDNSRIKSAQFVSLCR